MARIRACGDDRRTRFFAGEVETKQLCISDDTGAKTCVTKQQLDTLLGGAASPAQTGALPGDAEQPNTVPALDNQSNSQPPEQSVEPVQPAEQSL
mgnify:CR=1 FL=1